MIDPQITRRFQSEATFQEEKLRNLFRVIFCDEADAWKHWQTVTERRGFSRARAILKDHPTRLRKVAGLTIKARRVALVICHLNPRGGFGFKGFLQP